MRLKPLGPVGREAQTLQGDEAGQVLALPGSMDELALAMRVVEEGASLVRIARIVALIRSWMRRVGLSQDEFSRGELLRRMRECGDAQIRAQAEFFHGMLEILAEASQPDPASTDIPERLRNIEVGKLDVSIMGFVDYCRLSKGPVICYLTKGLENFNACGSDDRPGDGRGWNGYAYDRSMKLLGHKPKNVRDLIILVRCVPADLLRISNFGPKSLAKLTHLLESFCGLGEGELKNLTQDDIYYLKSLALGNEDAERTIPSDRP